MIVSKCLYVAASETCAAIPREEGKIDGHLGHLQEGSNANYIKTPGDETPRDVGGDNAPVAAVT